MDTDWCLTCERHLDANSPAPYCSKPCRPQPGPSRFPSYHGHPYSYYDTYSSDSDSQQSYYAEDNADESVFYHEIAAAVPTASYTANGDYSRIVAWANNVVPGAPADPAHHTPSPAPSSASSSSSTRTRCSSRASPQTSASSSRASSQSRISSINTNKVQSPTKTISPSTLLPPALLSPSIRRPLAPTLSFTPTHQTKSKPSRPLNTSHLPPTAYSSSNAYAHSSRTTSTAQDSSALATPASGVGVGAAFLDQVLSWVAPPSPMRSVPQSPIEKRAILSEKPALPHLYSRGRKSGRALA